MTRASPSLTDADYVSAYRKLASQYDDNQLSMQEYLSALQVLKERYLKGKSSSALPVVP
jgi:hypothetical protein